MHRTQKIESNLTRVLVTGLTANPGGVETVVVEYVRHLQGRIQFDFWVNTSESAFQRELEALGCGVFHGASYSRHPIAAHRDLTAFLRQRRGMYDVLWSNKSMCANVDDLVSTKRTGIPRRVIHAHNSRDMFTGPMGWLKAVQHRRNTTRLGTLATDYWACSVGAAEYFFQGEERNASTFRMVRNAVDPVRFEFDVTARQRLRQVLDIDESSPLVGFVGRLQFQKHPELAIEAFRVFQASHPSAMLVLLGDGDLRTACEDVVVKAGLKSSVRFLGVQHDTASWYSAFDVLVMPSRFEGLGMVAIEAQAAALPVIVTQGVPSEAAFTKLVQFLPVDAEPDLWAESLEAAMGSALTRGPMGDAVAVGGYDIATESARVGQLLRGVE